jgi:hypothetical protein
MFHATTSGGHQKTFSVLINLPARTPSTPPCLATSLAHVQPMSNNIHSNPFIPNIKKKHKNIKATNTTTCPSPFFLISVVVVVNYTPNQKTRESVSP